MLPRLLTIPDIKLIGLRARTSLSENKTAELWRGLMPRRREIGAIVSNRLYSVEIYDRPPDLHGFTPETQFEKWAAVEVGDFGQIPEGMRSLTLPGGDYAVFIHRGPAGDFHQTARYIFGTWLPASEFELDDRPHFEIMGEKYLGPANADSEEEVWIPVRKRVQTQPRD